MIEEKKFYWRLLDALKDGVYFVNTKRQVTYWNDAAEKITGYSKAEVLGKSCGDNILVHIDAEGNNLCKGACPLSESIKSGEPCESSIFLHHKDGHRIPVFVQVSPITDNKGEVIGAVEVFSDTSARGYFLDRVAALKDQALLDPISGIPNRNFLEKKIAARLWEMDQFGWPFGIIAIKIDCIEGLKDNGKDCYGDAIKLFAQTLIGNISPFDWIGRWIDPEEGEDRAHFVAVIQNTSEEKLEELAVIFRTLLQKTDLAPIDKDAKVSVSSGIAMAQAKDTPESLVNRAREAH